METADAVKYIIAGNLGVDAKTIDNSQDLVNDLGADSIGLVCITLGLEAFFELNITEDEAGKILTVQQAIDYVTERKGAE
jgi:acyl carrier protein